MCGCNYSEMMVRFGGVGVNRSFLAGGRGVWVLYADYKFIIIIFKSSSN